MLEGRLNEFRLGDVFQLIARTRKSGALTVDVEDRTGRVDFHGGQVTFAMADVRRTELGARLLSAGVVAEDALRRIVDAQQSGPGRVAAALLAEGLDEQLVGETLREHITDAVSTLLRSADGGFSFRPTDEQDDVPGPRLDTETLIAEGTRRLEEAERVRQRIPSAGTLIAMASNPPVEDGRVVVTPEQWRLLVLVNGSRTVAEVVDLTGQGEYATSQQLAELVESGLVEAVDPAEGNTALGELLARRARLRRLEQSELGGAAAAEPETRPGDIHEPVLLPDDRAPEPDPGPEADLELQPESAAEPEPAQALPEPAPEEALEWEPAPEEALEWEPAPEEALEWEPAPEEALDWAVVQASPTGPDEEHAARAEPDAPPQDQPAPESEAGGQAPRPDPDSDQVTRELAQLGFEDEPADRPDVAAPPTDQPPKRLTRDEDVTRSLLVRLMDGVRKA